MFFLSFFFFIYLLILFIFIDYFFFILFLLQWSTYKMNGREGELQAFFDFIPGMCLFALDFVKKNAIQMDL